MPPRRRSPRRPRPRRPSATAARRRLDVELVRRGLFPSREQARQAIDAGLIRVGGAAADKAARLVAAGDPIAVAGPRPRFVGRGGEKLAAALERFGIEVRGQRAVDAGSSTGGFTDCLLQAGAASVVAIDVGRHQLHERLRADARVDSREQTDIRTVEPGSIGGTVPLVVADLSFISLRSVVDALLRLCDPHGDLVLLVKPQFEAGRVEASKAKGVIVDPEIWRRTLGEVCDALAGRSAAIMGGMVSPLRGADGNVEFLIHARAPGSAGERATIGVDLDALVAAAAGDE